MNEGTFETTVEFGYVWTGSALITNAINPANDEFGRTLTATWQQVTDAGVSIFDAPAFGLFCYSDSARAAGFDLAPRPALKPMSAEMLAKLATLDEVAP